ncbi:MAG TPA: succinyl-diaminopimelate desuccinylase [Egibacteraceae bacterium]|nr:succinyl-diaminopimelate desuccinylase [Egibacteraceae bacterium]
MSDLGDLLLDLLAMPCVTGEEGPIAAWLEERYARRGERVRRCANSIVVGGTGDGRPTVLLVGHTDVVPPTPDDLTPRRDGERIVGRGASDMKAGLAVAMDCFEDMVLRAGPYDLLLVAYAGEEGSHDGNELGPVLTAMPDLAAADLAVVMEPTDLTVQLGCMGALHAEVTFRGQAAHSARPWQGRNALTAAAGLLDELHHLAPDDVTVDGMVYREVFTATRAWTGPSTAEGAKLSARNVVPPAFTVNVNYRFAPDKDLAEAERRVLALVDGRADVVIVDRAPAGRPRRDHPLVQRFLERVPAPVEPKQAWTDVARFSEVGVPALNFGPGVTAQAHQAGEYVPEANLRAARSAMEDFLSP